MPLTAAQLETFRRDGFLVIEDFVDRRACARLRRRAQELVDAFEPQEVASIFSTTDQEHLTDEYFLESGGKIRFFFEEDAFDPSGALRQDKALSINKIGHAMHDLDPEFGRFSGTPAIADLVGQLGFAEPLALQSMYIFKQPRIGGEVVYHQDTTFLYTEPASVIGLWFALEDANKENGCLWALPGGHANGIKARFRRREGGGVETVTLDPSPWPEDKFLPLEVPAGTLVVLHGALPHGSAPNRSEVSRHAYTLHIIDGACHYPADNWLQRGPEMPLRGLE